MVILFYDFTLCVLERKMNSNQRYRRRRRPWTRPHKILGQIIIINNQIVYNKI